MDDPVINLIVLAGIAVFLILKLRNVLGTREGFEKPPVKPDAQPRSETGNRRAFEVIEGGPDEDIIDHVDEGTPAADALTAMKRIEPDFSVGEFVHGARGAYEMILMAFENGELGDVRNFLADDVFDAFVDVVGAREDQGLTVEATFGGVREVTLTGAEFDRASNLAEITIRFVGDISSVVRDAEGTVIEGSPNSMKRQKDIWTFARTMGSDNPNWQLVATGG